MSNSFTSDEFEEAGNSIDPVSWMELADYCRGQSVILVGNSQATTAGNMGKRIDEYDVVVRMNHGIPRADLAEHMGVRTNIWACAFNRKPMQLTEFNSYWHIADFVLRFGYAESLHLDIRKSSKWVLFENERGNAEYQQLANEIGANPSTGVMTAYFFISKISSYSKCDIVGFDHFDKPNPILLSKDPRRLRTSFHKPRLERRFMDELLKKYGARRLEVES